MFYRVLHKLIRRFSRKYARLRDGVYRIIDRIYVKEIESTKNVRTNINFHCVMWGQYLDWFFSYTVPSLLQDGNVPSLARDGYELKLVIYTQPEEYDAVAKQYDPLIALIHEYMSIDVIPLSELKGGRWLGYYWDSWTAAMVDGIKRCINNDAIMVLCLPDFIFGNRSITNAIKLVQGKNVFLAATHARVSQESILTSGAFTRLKMLEGCVENDELVDLAFEHGHQYLDGFFDNEDTNCTHDLMSIRRIDESTYSIINNSPSPFVGNFVNDDLKWFARAGYGWDKRWPRLLFRQNRLKFVGSSEVFFLVELTAADGRHLPTMQVGSLNNDKYLTRSHRMLQNYVFNSFYCVWKGREARTRY